MMAKKIIIIDTSILCVWFKVPGKDTAKGWTYDKVNNHIEQGLKTGSMLVLPMASIIETGNHIAHVDGDRYILATNLVDTINKSIDPDNTSWASFTAQEEMWKDEQLKSLAENWLKQVGARQSLGDASIVEIANYYAKIPGYDVEIFTADEGLKACEPIKPPQQPRRRKK